MLKKALIFVSLLSPTVLTYPAQASELPANPVMAQQQAQQENMVNINTASAEELAAALKGVGLKRAKAIIALRERLGGFTDIDQLLEVRGLGVRTLDANRAHIRL